MSSRQTQSAVRQPQPATKPAQAPRALDRGLLHEMELDFNNSSGSEHSPPAEAVQAPSARARANGLPPPSAVPSVMGRDGARASDVAAKKGTKSEGAAVKAKTGSGAKETKEAKEKKGGKKAKKAKKGAGADDAGYAGPSLNSLLGLSDDDEAPATAPAPKRGSMASLSDMPPLF